MTVVADIRMPTILYLLGSVSIEFRENDQKTLKPGENIQILMTRSVNVSLHSWIQQGAFYVREAFLLCIINRQIQAYRR